MKFYVYILKSKNRPNWSYVGSTSNLEQRIKNHCAGKTRSTKAYRPLLLVYVETYPSKDKAYKRELYFKSGYGREEKELILLSCANSGVV